MNVTMPNSEAARSDALGTRVADLKIRMQQARITMSEMKTFQRVAAMMEDGRGSIDGDDLIAASFLPTCCWTRRRSETMRTISKLFDSHAEAARVAGVLVAVGVPRVQIAVIGPYRDEVAVFKSPGVILGTVGAALACLGAMAVCGVSPFPAGLPSTALVCAVCAGGLLGAFVTTAAMPDDRSVADGIVLVTAHVDENATDIVQAVLGGCIPTAFIAEAA